MRTIHPLLPAAALLLAGLAACDSRSGRDDLPPSVIFIVCDTLRADHLGCYGYERETSPNLDALAADSHRFTAALAQAPATIPSMWNMMTSRYQAWIPTPEDQTTLAEHFRMKGFRTGAFLAHHFLTPGMSQLDQGFIVYNDSRGDGHDPHGNTLRRAESVTDAAIEWYDRNGDRPVFMWLVYFDPHDPYLPPPGYDGHWNPEESFSGDRRADGLHKESREVTDEHRQYLVNAYDEEIRYMDSELGRFLDRLRETGDYERSVIVFTSDHGEELGDNGNRWGHSQLLSQEELHVPLLIKLPGTGQGRVHDVPAQTIDVYPTLVELFDRDTPPPHVATLEGDSLLPWIEGRAVDRQHEAVAFWLYQAAVVAPGIKYWMTNEGEWLLDLESGDVLDDPATLERLRDLAGTKMSDHDLVGSYYTETVEYLRSLGYF